ncbi:MAG TPA: hypothetical protein VLI67_05810, partial [Vicinamibacteria bacterium]|nr:hypothetical protein [Vicinamibacteria bacterium]
RVWSTVPTLFVSGTLDGGAPAFQAEEMRFGLPRSGHVRVVHGSHETLVAAEVREAVVEFLAGAEPMDRTLEVPPPRFLTVEEAKAALAPPR